MNSHLTLFCFCLALLLNINWYTIANHHEYINTSTTIHITMTRHRNSPSAKWAHRTKKIAKSMLKSIISVKFFDQLMHMNDLEEEELNTALLEYMEKKKVGAVRKDSALNRRFRQRKSWAEFESGLTDRQFRRYFRMSRECFQLLCDRIEANVGEEEFKSEEYLKNLKHTDVESEKKKVNLMYAHEASTGGFVSGEIKLALTLRLLAGGSYLDLSLLYEVGSSYAYSILHDVVKNWILDDRLVKINGLDYINDDDRLEKGAL
jgi:hypothetical protein